MFGLRSARGRAIVAGVVLVALLVSFAGLAVQRVHELQRQHDSLQRTSAVATALEQARAQLFQQKAALAGLALSGDPGLVDVHDEAAAALEQDLSQARVGMLAEGDADEVLALEDVTERIGGFNEEIANAIPTVLEADPETRLWLASAGNAEMAPAVNAFTAELDRLAEIEQNELAAKTAAADRAADTTLWLFIGLGAASFLVAAGTVAMLVLSVVRPLASLQAKARAITAGDLQVRAEVSGPQEIASLARDFNEMTNALWSRTKEYIDTTNLTGDVIVRLDKDGMFTFLNDGACQFFGRPREELLGTDAGSFMHPEDLERAGQAVREVIESKELVRGFESRLVTPMGTRVVEWNGYPLFDGEDQYAGIQITGRDTTERKQMEEALYAKTQEYVATANLTGDIIGRADEEGRWVFLNDAACQFFGKSREELLGTDARASLHPEDLEPTVRAVEEARDRKEPISGFINRQMTPMGTRVLEWNASPLFDGEGRYTGIQMTGRDITDRKQMEEELRESEEKYRRVVQNSIDGIAIVQGLEIKFVNRAVLKMFGYRSEKELVGHPFTDFLSPDWRDLLVERARARQEGKRVPASYEFKALRKDGSEFHGELSVGKITYQGSAALQAIVRDVTERKRAEEELQSSEERLKILFEFAPDAYYLNDLQGNFVDGNRAAEELIGHKREELIGKNLLDVKLLPPEQIPQAAADLAKNAQGLPTGPDEFTLNRKDGTQVPAEIRTFPVKVKDQTLVLGIARDITERKQMEEGLRESEEKYRRLIEDSIDGITIIEDVQVRFVNRAIVEMFGYRSEQEIIGRPFTDFISPDYRELMVERGHARQAGEDPPNGYEFRALRKDGSEFPAELSIGRIVYQGRAALQGIVRDITERKQAEEALRESETRYRLLAENATDIIWTMDVGLRYTYVSPSVARMRGYAPEELVGKTVQETLTPTSLEIARKTLAEELAMEKTERKDVFRSRTLELDMYCKDGSTVCTEVRVTFLRNPDGQPVGILGVTRDISERKRAEQALRDSEERFRSLTGSAPIGIFLTDAQGDCVYANPRLQAIAGLTLEESLGRGWSTVIHPDDRQVLLDEASTAAGLERELSYEFRILTREGELRWAHVHTSPMFSTEGEVMGRVGSVEDITERKRAEEEIHRRNEELALFLELSKTVASTIEVGELVERALDRVTRVLPQADAVTLAIYDRDEDALKFKAARGVNPKAYLEIVLKPGEGMAGKAFKLGETVLYSSPEEMRAALTDMSPANRQLLRAATQDLSLVQSAICCPLLTDSRVLGVLTSATSAADAPFGPSEVALLEAAADHIAIALHKAQLHSELEMRAITDSLTDLHDHAHFYSRLTEEIERSKRYNHGFAVVMLDVDDFKRFNDSRGHQAGDQMLRFVADCIRSGLRRSDIAFRYGGDEFAAILPHADSSKARAVVNRINGRITSSLKEMDGEAATRLSLSAGVACFPDDGTTTDDLVRVADAALYSAKWVARARDIMGQREDIQSLVSALVSRRAGVEAPADGTIFRPEALHEQHARIVSSVASSIAVALKDAGVPQALEDPDLQIVALVGAAAEIKDRYIRGHPERTSEQAVALAEKLGLPPERVRDIRIAGLLHDIGKVTVSESILNKPGKLTRREFATIKDHPIVGATLVSQARGFERLAPIIRHHHERFDGKGYPDGLAGEDIPLEAHILSVVDVFDALTHERSYRKALSREEALAELERCAGTQFDPTVVKAFLASVKRRGEEPAAPAQAASEDRQLTAARVPGRGKR